VSVAWTVVTAAALAAVYVGEHQARHRFLKARGARGAGAAALLAAAALVVG
jgi:hypothetical protein